MTRAVRLEQADCYPRGDPVLAVHTGAGPVAMERPLPMFVF